MGKRFLTVRVLALVVISTALTLFLYSPQSTQAENDCPQVQLRGIRLKEGLLSLTNPASKGNFSSSTSFCLTGTQAVIPLNLTSLGSYAEMKSIFFDQVKLPDSIGTYDKKPLGSYGSYKGLTALDQNNFNMIMRGDTTKGLPPIDSNFNDPGKSKKGYLLQTASNLMISGDFTGSKPLVLFINGSLTINSDLSYSETDSSGGLVFIVRDDIRIADTVSKVDAVLITFGEFCSSWVNIGGSMECGIRPISSGSPTPSPSPPYILVPARVYIGDQVPVSWSNNGLSSPYDHIELHQVNGDQRLDSFFLSESSGGRCSQAPPTAAHPVGSCVYDMPAQLPAVTPGALRYQDYQFQLYSSRSSTLLSTSGIQVFEFDSNPLTLNGSVISLNSAFPPKFVRNNSNKDTPAETINFQPKYLVILKNIFSRELAIWSEIK